MAFLPDLSLLAGCSTERFHAEGARVSCSRGASPRGARPRGARGPAGIAAAILLVTIALATGSGSASEANGGGAGGAAGVAAAAGGDAAARIREGARGASVVLIVMDAAKAAGFSFYGGGVDSTPNLARLASQSLVFDGAIAPASYTVASLGSLHTGRFPLAHGLLRHENRLSLGETTLAERLAAAGYRTIGVAGTSNGSSQYAFDQGFETWREVFHHDPTLHRPPPFDPRRTSLAQASLVTGAIPRPLRPAPDAPVFLYLHFREPHAPYLVPAETVERFGGKGYEGVLSGDATSRLLAAEEGKLPLTPRDRRYVQALYEASLWVVDRAIGEVLDRLRAENLDEHTILIVTADHGEELFEHGHWGHSRQLYDESTHIPLLLRLPEACGVAPGRIPDPVTLTDLLPTILDLLSLPAPDGAEDGRSLVGRIARRDATPAFRTLASLTYPGRGIRHEVSLRTPRWKYLWKRGGGEELYDLTADPHERHDLAPRAPRGALRLARARAMRWMRGWSERRRAGEERDAISPEQEEQLRALGYLGSQPGPDASPGTDANPGTEREGVEGRDDAKVLETLRERYDRFATALDSVRILVREVSWVSGDRRGGLDDLDAGEALYAYRLVRRGADRYEVRDQILPGEILEPRVFRGITGPRNLYREAGETATLRSWRGPLREPFFASQLLFDIGTARLEGLLRSPAQRIDPPMGDATAGDATAGNAIAGNSTGENATARERIGLRWPATARVPVDIELGFDPRYPFPVAAAALRPGASRPFESYEVLETTSLEDGLVVPTRIRRRWASNGLPPAHAGPASDTPWIEIVYAVEIQAFGEALGDAAVDAARAEIESGTPAGG